MKNEKTYIADAAMSLDDPYASLSQHLHGDGDAIQRCAECDCEGGSSECNWIKSGPAALDDLCATPGCTNPPVIRLDDRHLCRGCYAIHDFGDNA